MHELSIASSLYAQVKRHTPPGAVVRQVKVLIGPMQGIEPDSLQLGWEATCREDHITPPQLLLELPGWKLACPQCQRRWESPELYVACTCGCATPKVEGGAELQLISIEVENP